jgi:hypothetical protein
VLGDDEPLVVVLLGAETNVACSETGPRARMDGPWSDPEYEPFPDPLHPSKIEPPSGVALSRTVVPATTQPDVGPTVPAPTLETATQYSAVNGTGTGTLAPVTTTVLAVGAGTYRTPEAAPPTSGTE